ncbi:unnamed protein product [Adineta steineri]|uniref:Uncharacterized protein n=1 Tax=Adineta steineri TaxID=433720 RepID=A0A819XPP7_9BILA|nr:unnamed protein product [Adineta steineri]
MSPLLTYMIGWLKKEKSRCPFFDQARLTRANGLANSHDFQKPVADSLSLVLTKWSKTTCERVDPDYFKC